MTASQVVFYIISAFILATGILAVTTRKIFRSAIWLLFSLVSIAALFFWLQLEFIAAVQITVYVGGIVVLVIFSIFLTQQSGTQMARPLPKRAFIAALVALSGFVLSYFLVIQHNFKPSGIKAFNADVSTIGTQLMSAGQHGYVLPFEVISILLLAAMIGCIVIATKGPPKIQIQDGKHSTKEIINMQHKDQ